MEKISKYMLIALMNTCIFAVCFAIGYFVIMNGEIKGNIVQAANYAEKEQYNEAYKELNVLRENTKIVWAQKRIDGKIKQLEDQAFQEWKAIPKQYEVEESEIVREKIILFIDRYEYSAYYTQAKKFLDNMNAYDVKKEQRTQLQGKENDLLQKIANLQGLKDALNQSNSQIAEKEFQKISTYFMKDDIFSETEMIQMLDLMKKKDEVTQLKEDRLYVFRLIQSLVEGKEVNTESQQAIFDITQMIQVKMDHSKAELRQILIQQEEIEKQLEMIQDNMLGSTAA